MHLNSCVAQSRKIVSKKNHVFIQDPQAKDIDNVDFSLRERTILPGQSKFLGSFSFISCLDSSSSSSDKLA